MVTDDWSCTELVAPEAILDAVEDVEAWGFPRQVDGSEIEMGTWFRMGRGVVWWYEGVQASDQSGLVGAWVHLAVAPRYRGQWPVRRWHYAVQVVGELLGARFLVFAPCDAEPEGIVDYARRLGWSLDESSGTLMLGLGGRGGQVWASSPRQGSPVSR